MACPVLFRRYLILLKSPGRVWEAHKAVHRVFYEHVELHVWTTRYEWLKAGEHLRLRIPNITPELIASFDWTPWLPWNYAKALPQEERGLAI